MREIIFRGVTTNLVKNEFVYGYYQKIIGYGPNDFGEEYHLIVNENDESDYVDEKTVGMFTGLKDKNGTKIFEGDIFKDPDDDNLKLTCIFENGSFKIQIEGVKGALMEYGYDETEGEYGIIECEHFDFYDFEFEVIGNIHEVNHETTM